MGHFRRVSGAAPPHPPPPLPHSHTHRYTRDAQQLLDNVGFLLYPKTICELGGSVCHATLLAHPWCTWVRGPLGQNYVYNMCHRLHTLLNCRYVSSRGPPIARHDTFVTASCCSSSSFRLLLLGHLTGSRRRYENVIQIGARGQKTDGTEHRC